MKMELTEVWDKTQSSRGTVSMGKKPSWSEVAHPRRAVTRSLCICIRLKVQGLKLKEKVLVSLR